MSGRGRMECAVFSIAIMVLVSTSGQVNQLVPPAVRAFSHDPAQFTLSANKNYTEIRPVTAERDSFFPDRAMLNQAIFASQVSHLFGERGPESRTLTASLLLLSDKVVEVYGLVVLPLAFCHSFS